MAGIKGVPILISVDANTSGEDKPEEALRLITTGRLYERPDETMIRYEESLDEQEPPQKIELSIQEGVVTMSRHGSFEAKMVFAKGKRYESKYHTPYGDLDMALYCTKASYQKVQNGGELTLQYQLDLGGQYAAMHNMQLHWMRKKDA